MSTNMQHITPQPKESSSVVDKATNHLGLDLSSGMEAAVSAALSRLQKILCEISSEELKQVASMARANNLIAQHSATSTKQVGKQQFIEALSQGIATITGGVISIGSVGIGAKKGLKGKELKKLDQEQMGMEKYENVLKQDFRANVNEQQGQQLGADHAEQVNNRLNTLKGQRSFVDREGRGLDPAQHKASNGAKTDKELIESMTKQQRDELQDVLNKRFDDLGKQKRSLADQGSATRQGWSAAGQSVGQIIGGSGTIIGATTKETQAENQAEGQLANAASQGMQSIMSQLLKVANDALSQAQQMIQTFATISSGNRFQG